MKNYILLILLISTCSASCKKYLDAKPQSSLATIENLQDLQALLDNTKQLNGDDYGVGSFPIFGELGTDDYIMNEEYLNYIFIDRRNAYLWKQDIFEGQPSVDWNNAYQGIFYTNYILEQLENFERNPGNSIYWDNIKGSALFYRSWIYFNLVQLFSPQYQQNNAKTALGLPLVFSSNIYQNISRANLEDTYAQILLDLKSAISFLPTKAIYNTRPSKAAAYSLFSNIYLQQSNYNQAKLYADSVLLLQNNLIDYNSITNTAFPFSYKNPEVIFLASNSDSYINAEGASQVDTSLMKTYAFTDLRKALFFNESAPNVYNFKGNYTGYDKFFCGYAVDEIYLIRAEAKARLGNTNSALEDLNLLLSKRYENGTFNPYKNLTQSEVIKLILLERRKELIFRSRRWPDLKRLNLSPAFAVTLKRVIENNTITLPPNDKRYVYPIPNDVIVRSNIPQNER
ncbi:SusD-like starch-binding protein associating with outer membrane [Chitinophaga skermanii]|uniref:SusD-like starch-binding protein associating with outer membrane n=2 Tax=Chitinophaga skermanii TaxID=331697 RepID=A0A327QTF6_9BACT|nr:SusD-like starch-binding protein associating with outer membrane [Chitinophaga skermanii]